MTILHTVTNLEVALRADVVLTPNGAYAVLLTDLDADKTLPAIHRATKAAAIEYAMLCVKSF